MDTRVGLGQTFIQAAFHPQHAQGRFSLVAQAGPARLPAWAAKAGIVAQHGGLTQSCRSAGFTFFWLCSGRGDTALRLVAHPGDVQRAPATHSLRTVIWFWVRVPLLSVQITEVSPSVSTIDSFLTSTPSGPGVGRPSPGSG